MASRRLAAKTNSPNIEQLLQLRDPLGFEVQEISVGEGAPEPLVKAYADHAPVAIFDGNKLFNFQMDENVLKVRLREWRERHPGGA